MFYSLILFHVYDPFQNDFGVRAKVCFSPYDILVPLFMLWPEIQYSLGGVGQLRSQHALQKDLKA